MILKEPFVSESWPLSGGKWAAHRYRQQRPRDGDLATVRAYVLLPGTQHGSLQPDLIFGERCKVGSGHLYSTWGSSGITLHLNVEFHLPYFRYEYNDFCHATWCGAFVLAKAWATHELEGLEAMLRQRAQALADAEHCDCNECRTANHAAGVLPKRRIRKEVKNDGQAHE